MLALMLAHMLAPMLALNTHSLRRSAVQDEEIYMFKERGADISAGQYAYKACTRARMRLHMRRWENTVSNYSWLAFH